MVLFDRNIMWMIKAPIQGVYTATGSSFLYSYKHRVNIPLIGTSMPLTVVAFALGTSASLLSDYVHKMVKKDIHLSEKARDEASLFLSVLASGVLFTGGLYLTNKDLPLNYGVFSAMAIGGIASAGADFTALALK